MMTHQTTESDAWLQAEFELLTEACVRLKTHPTLAALQGLTQLGAQHATMLLHYADQLEGLLTTIDRHAATLRRMAEADRRAAEFSAAARSAVAEVECTLRPLITTLRTKAVDPSTPLAIAPSRNGTGSSTGNRTASTSSASFAKGKTVHSWGSSDDDLCPDRVLH
jgi:septal ring factor EnvC (AmiA/AmiB activator)